MNFKLNPDVTVISVPSSESAVHDEYVSNGRPDIKALTTFPVVASFIIIVSAPIGVTAVPALNIILSVPK